MEIRQILEQNINKAQEGRNLWIEICNKYKLGDEDYVILMPSLNAEYNYYALLHLSEFIDRVRAEKIIILTYDENVKKIGKMFSNKICDIYDFSREEAEYLMKFYCLYMFTDKLIIISLEEPEGRNGRQLIGKKGITLEELIAIGIYGLKECKKIIPPNYNGNDEKIKKFLSIE
ncbi:hypothetical protein B0P06_003368 [Clostridium saccharoperbutylacetonicum]|uniref:Uncharacterized protein n=1 Tax=Clostridium saccharoperbutylacetonicum N1-4(HMT) TaxID=931276 RepID=M1N4F4_9CLOT|nr:hypothetical protein [Clostridium saccharoperbutylacetonicum]AGF58317.1 hypothetical protein Cspa_c45640 [Clostridium saccharoperbutylacetonicum N1-4(HMT)]NRT60906.1 hypothetical protein [Clostridium saccharoperbutylacetonicum]NSB24219.1 hypothetical protein [Clostridium saccharoperbutylacetonicum]NSB43597.1 hypothetical protein [Clostridium saccharoperbutylacetonicum]